MKRYKFLVLLVVELIITVCVGIAAYSQGACGDGWSLHTQVAPFDCLSSGSSDESIISTKMLLSWVFYFLVVLFVVAALAIVFRLEHKKTVR